MNLFSFFDVLLSPRVLPVNAGLNLREDYQTDNFNMVLPVNAGLNPYEVDAASFDVGVLPVNAGLNPGT